MKKILFILLVILTVALAQTPTRYALVNPQNAVENIIIYDGDDPYKLPTGWLLVRLSAATQFVEIGCTYDRTARAFACPDEK
jgi:hypothetical protein